MKIIYEPKGKAREYSALSANLYTGCNHGCKYCYAPGIGRVKRAEYIFPMARKNIVNEFEKECKELFNSKKAVLFCFMTDPYNIKEKELFITRQCLEIALLYKIPIKVLTKSALVLRDIDIFKKFKNHISIGGTLTFYDNKKSKEWEPGASPGIERLLALKTLHENNIKTWASFEPVIEPKESLTLLEKSLSYIDYFKIGKINNFMGIDKTINWSAFLKNAIGILRANNKEFYIKKDLRDSAPDIKLNNNEKDMDLFTVDQF